MPIPSVRVDRSITRFILAFVLIFTFANPSFSRTLVDMNDYSSGLPLENTNALLRVVYFASTKGEIFPCPTCGDNSMGGLSRRSFLLKELRKSTSPVVVLAGPEEFLSDLDTMRFKQNPTEINKDTEKSKAEKILKAYNLLDIDAGWLSVAEAKWINSYAGSIPKGLSIVTKDPISKIVSTSVGKVGVVLFPIGTGANKTPTEEQKQAILKAGKELQKKVSLVIGISPWGSTAEYRFLPQAEDIFSIVFGGGGGLGFAYSNEYSTQKILWSRSESLGRGINTVDVMEVPAPGQPASWLEGVSFNAEQTFLFTKLPTDPIIDAFIGADSRTN